MAGKDTEFFSNKANCYGYAVKCATPANSSSGKQATPGGNQIGADFGDYCDRLKRGVLSDGGNKVNLLFEGNVNALTPAVIPAARADWYLIAMLVRSSGFHFIRRQRKKFSGEPIWKWKQGNPGLVERNAFDATANKWIRITNAELPELIQGKFVSDPPGYKGWEKIYFFEVHKDGFSVAVS